MYRMAVALALLACFGASGKGAQQLSDLDYKGDGVDAHRLDLFLPADPSRAALVVFVHGGAFMQGGRKQFDSVGRALAREGLAVAVVSYRLYPETNADGATQDVADATAWLITHAADFGLGARNVFLVGHSAGAQIAAVVATDAKYLGASGIGLSALRGVFAVAGAYDVRDLSGEPDSWQRVDGHIYGETAAARRAFSPVTHIDPGTPPIVTSCGTEDDPYSCNRAMGFATALRAAGVRATTIQERGADHMGMLRALVDPKDPLNAALLYFISNLEVS